MIIHISNHPHPKINLNKTSAKCMTRNYQLSTKHKNYALNKRNNITLEQAGNCKHYITCQRHVPNPNSMIEFNNRNIT